MKIKAPTQKLILGLFWANQALFAQAVAPVSRGQEGSGGIVVACFQNEEDYTKVIKVLKDNRENNLRVDPLKNIDLNTVSVRLLDLYLEEGFNDNGTSYIEAAPGDTALKVLEDRIRFISQHSSIGDRLEYLHRETLNYKKWKKSLAGVAALDDTAAQINVDANCTFLTLAFQDRIAGLTTVYFDPRLFNKLTTVEQAALFVHEYLYHDAKLQGMKDSRAVRLVVSALFKKSFATSNADLDSFHSDLEAMKFLNFIKPDLFDSFFARFTYDFQGKTLNLENGVVADEGIAYGRVVAAKSRFYKNGILEFGYLASAQELNGLLFSANRSIEFYESGELKKGTLEQDYPGYLPTSLKKSDRVLFFESGSLRRLRFDGPRVINGIPCGRPNRQTNVSFYENQKFRACDLENRITYDGLDINLKLETYPSGKIKMAYLNNKTKLFSVEANALRDFEASKALCFDETQRVISCKTVDLISAFAE